MIGGVTGKLIGRPTASRTEVGTRIDNLGRFINYEWTDDLFNAQLPDRVTVCRDV